MTNRKRQFSVEQKHSKDHLELILTFSPDIKVEREKKNECVVARFDKMSFKTHLANFEDDGYISMVLEKNESKEFHRTSSHGDEFDSIKCLQGTLVDIGAYVSRSYLENFQVDFHSSVGNGTGFYFNLVRGEADI